jgi:hypothetical protein
MESAKRSTENNSRLPFLLGLAVVLAGLVLWDWRPDWGGQRAPGKGMTSPVAAKWEKDNVATASGLELAGSESQLVNPLSTLELDKLHDTIRRPLFEQRRRPVEPPPARASVVVAPSPVPRRSADPNALTLLGILLSEGRTIALLNRNQTGQNVRVEEGDTVDGWTIERIEAQRVVLRHGDTKIALQLFRKR